MISAIRKLLRCFKASLTAYISAYGEDLAGKLLLPTRIADPIASLIINHSAAFTCYNDAVIVIVALLKQYATFVLVLQEFWEMKSWLN